MAPTTTLPNPSICLNSSPAFATCSDEHPSLRPPTSTDTHEIIRSEDLTIDQISHSVTLGDKTLEMKPREFSLLAMLAANKGRAFTRNQILERLWGHDYIGDSRTVDVHVRWLREKIETDPSKPRRIVTIRGLGYRFDG